MPPWIKDVHVGNTSGPAAPVDYVKNPADNLAITDIVDAQLTSGSAFGGNFGGNF